MKCFLIILALGLASTDKLDRTYLPPPGSKLSGGSPGAIQVPLEPFPGRNDGLPSLGDSQVELGISRGLSEPQANKGNVGPFPNAQNSFKVPTTTTSYAFTQTTTLPPVYETTVGPFSTVSIPSTQMPVGSYGNEFGRGLVGNVPQQPGTIIGNRQGGYNYQLPGDVANPNLQPFGGVQRQDFNQQPFSQRYGNIEGPVNIIGQQGPTSGNANNPGYAQSFNEQIPSQYQQEQQGQRDLIPSTPTPQFTTTSAQTPYGSYNVQPGSYGQYTPQVSSYSQISENSGVPGGLQTKQPVYGLNTPNQAISNLYRQDSLNPTGAQTLGNSPNIYQPSTTFAPSVTSSFASYTDTPTSPERFSTTPFPDIVSSSTFPSTVSNQQPSIRYKPRPERPQAESDRNAVILNYENVLTPDGYSYAYDTSNGIHADESGTAIDGVKAKGSYSYIGDDGKVYSVTYTADENGFQPRGDHLPTPHPIPEAIQRVIEQAARDEDAGIIDDGSYDEAKYGYEKYQRPIISRRPQVSQSIVSNGADFPRVYSINLAGDSQPSNDREQYDNGLIIRGKPNKPVNQDSNNGIQSVSIPNSDQNIASQVRPSDIDISRGRRPQFSSTSTPETQSVIVREQSINSGISGKYPQDNVPVYGKNNNAYPTENTPTSEIRNTIGNQGPRRGRPQTSVSSSVSNTRDKSPVNQSTSSMSRVNQPINFQRRNGQNSFTPINQAIDEETGYQYNQPEKKFRQETTQFPTRFTETTTEYIAEERGDRGMSTAKPFITPYIYNQDEEDDNVDQPGTKQYSSKSNSNKFDDNNPEHIKESTASDLITGDDETSTTLSNPGSATKYSNYDSPRATVKGTLRPGQNAGNRYQSDATSPDFFASTTPMSNYYDQTTIQPSYNATQPTYSGPVGFTSGIPTTTFAPSFDSFGQNLGFGPGLTVDGFGRPIPGQNNQGFVNEQYSTVYPSTSSGPSSSSFSSTNINGERNPDLNRETFNPSVVRFGKPIQEPTSITFPDANQTTQKVIGEDFRGPKQSQRFDERTGYHY